MRYRTSNRAPRCAYQRRSLSRRGREPVLAVAPPDRYGHFLATVKSTDCLRRHAVRALAAVLPLMVFASALLVPLIAMFPSQGRFSTVANDASERVIVELKVSIPAVEGGRG